MTENERHIRLDCAALMGRLLARNDHSQGLSLVGEKLWARIRSALDEQYKNVGPQPSEIDRGVRAYNLEVVLFDTRVEMATRRTSTQRTLSIAPQA